MNVEFTTDEIIVLRSTLAMRLDQCVEFEIADAEAGRVDHHLHFTMDTLRSALEKL